MKIKFISRNEDGNYYVGYEFQAKRSINPTTYKKAKELVVLGIPAKKWKQFCEDNGIFWEDSNEV